MAWACLLARSPYWSGRSHCMYCINRERDTQPVKTRRVSILIHLHTTDANFPQRGLIGARLILTPYVDLQMLGCVWYGALLPIFSKRQRVIWGIFYTALLLGHKYIAVHGI